MNVKVALISKNEKLSELGDGDDLRKDRSVSDVSDGLSSRTAGIPDHRRTRNPVRSGFNQRLLRSDFVKKLIKLYLA